MHATREQNAKRAGRVGIVSAEGRQAVLRLALGCGVLHHMRLRCWCGCAVVRPPGTSLLQAILEYCLDRVGERNAQFVGPVMNATLQQFIPSPAARHDLKRNIFGIKLRLSYAPVPFPVVSRQILRQFGLPGVKWKAVGVSSLTAAHTWIA